MWFIFFSLMDDWWLLWHKSILSKIQLLLHNNNTYFKSKPYFLLLNRSRVLDRASLEQSLEAIAWFWTFGRTNYPPGSPKRSFQYIRRLFSSDQYDLDDRRLINCTRWQSEVNVSDVMYHVLCLIALPEIA